MRQLYIFNAFNALHCKTEEMTGCVDMATPLYDTSFESDQCRRSLCRLRVRTQSLTFFGAEPEPITERISYLHTLMRHIGKRLETQNGLLAASTVTTTLLRLLFTLMGPAGRLAGQHGMQHGAKKEKEREWRGTLRVGRVLVWKKKKKEQGNLFISVP